MLTAATATVDSRGVGRKDSDKAMATAAMATVDSRDMGGKDSGKASNGEGSNGDR